MVSQQSHSQAWHNGTVVPELQHLGYPSSRSSWKRNQGPSEDSDRTQSASNFHRPTNSKRGPKGSWSEKLPSKSLEDDNRSLHTTPGCDHRHWRSKLKTFATTRDNSESNKSEGAQDIQQPQSSSPRHAKGEYASGKQAYLFFPRSVYGTTSESESAEHASDNDKLVKRRSQRKRGSPMVYGAAVPVTVDADGIRPTKKAPPLSKTSSSKAVVAREPYKNCESAVSDCLERNSPLERGDGLRAAFLEQEQEVSLSIRKVAAGSTHHSTSQRPVQSTNRDTEQTGTSSRRSDGQPASALSTKQNYADSTSNTTSDNSITRNDSGYYEVERLAAQLSNATLSPDDSECTGFYRSSIPIPTNSPRRRGRPPIPSPDTAEYLDWKSKSPTLAPPYSSTTSLSSSQLSWHTARPPARQHISRSPLPQLTPANSAVLSSEAEIDEDIIPPEPAPRTKNGTPYPDPLISLRPRRGTQPCPHPLPRPLPGLPGLSRMPSYPVLSSITARESTYENNEYTKRMSQAFCEAEKSSVGERKGRFSISKNEFKHFRKNDEKKETIHPAWEKFGTKVTLPSYSEVGGRSSVPSTLTAGEPQTVEAQNKEVHWVSPDMDAPKIIKKIKRGEMLSERPARLAPYPSSSSTVFPEPRSFTNPRSAQSLPPRTTVPQGSLKGTEQRTPDHDQRRQSRLRERFSIEGPELYATGVAHSVTHSSTLESLQTYRSSLSLELDQDERVRQRMLALLDPIMETESLQVDQVSLAGQNRVHSLESLGGLSTPATRSDMKSDNDEPEDKGPQSGHKCAARARQIHKLERGLEKTRNKVSYWRQRLRVNLKAKVLRRLRTAKSGGKLNCARKKNAIRLES